ncbi:amidase family protein, partial [Mesorhizobium sp.]
YQEASPASATAPAVQALLDSGARFVGKTQTDELAFSLMGLNAHFPSPVNPAAPDRVTGGSSSGSAAAIAGGLADIAAGSDTGGSIRAPASFCGLIGLRTT